MSTESKEPVVTVQKKDLIAVTSTCPACKLEGCKRHSIRTNKQWDLDGVTLHLRRSVHYCTRCRSFFKHKEDEIRRGRYTHAVRKEALRLIFQGKSLECVAQTMRRKHKRHVPPTTLHEWKVEVMEEATRAQAKKAADRPGRPEAVFERYVALTTP